MGVAAVGALCPPFPVAAGGGRSRLDGFVPVCQFREFHEIRVHASARAVFRAVESVTAGEIRFFRLLTWIRAPRLSGERGEDILAAPADRPLIEVALHSGFLPLAEDPDRELVFGTIFGGGLPAVGEGGPRNSLGSTVRESARSR